MNSITDRQLQLMDSLRHQKYREAFHREHLKGKLALQIRLLRETRPWTQRELGERTGKAQSVISQLEDPDYGNYTLKTLFKLADAFEVAFSAGFLPFSDLAGQATSVHKAQMLAPKFADDYRLMKQRRIVDQLAQSETAISTADPEKQLSFTAAAHIEPIRVPFAGFIAGWTVEPEHSEGKIYATANAA